MRRFAPWVGISILSMVVPFSIEIVADDKAEAKKEKPKKTRIEGHTFNSAGKPLLGVDVTVWVLGQKDSVIAQRTDKTGKYLLEAELSGPFDISYVKAKYRLAVVSRLAGQENQRISKVLYRKGEVTPVTAIHDYLLGIDRIVVLALSLEKPSRVSFLKQLKDEDEERFELAKLSLPTKMDADLQSLLQARQDDLLKRLERLR